MPRSRRLALTLFISATFVVGAGAAVSANARDLLLSFVTARRTAIDSGLAVVEVFQEPNADLAVIGAVRTTADSDDLVAWFREIEQLQRSRYIPLIQRFSDPPQMSDLATLVLDDGELDELRGCEPGSCKMKLAAAEMAQVRAAITAAGAEWKPAAQDAFRQIVLARARSYRAHGFAGALPYEDHKKRVVPATEFQALLGDCDVPGPFPPALATHLRSLPHGRPDTAESFLFWSKDTLGDAKSIVGITDVSIFNRASADEPTVVAAVQVFATHYLTASFSLTAIVEAPDSQTRYLVYTRRSRVDVFRGIFGGFVRRVVKKRLRSEGPALLDGLRKKLESGTPS